MHVLEIVGNCDWKAVEMYRSVHMCVCTRLLRGPRGVCEVCRVLDRLQNSSCTLLKSTKLQCDNGNCKVVTAAIRPCKLGCRSSASLAGIGAFALIASSLT